MLVDFQDQTLCDLIEYGFPYVIGKLLRSSTSPHPVKNQNGAKDFPAHVQTFLMKEAI